ncbi:hypothetical protein Mapa_004123 [Marchantia paleacea]|nr:hypothetical protein Mapa_004123 [Marchantia paleacea]
MGAGSSDDPKLLVPPPLFQRDLRPSDLEQRQQQQSDRDGEQVSQESHVQALHDELSREQGKRRQEAVDDQENRGEGVHSDVEVRNALKNLHPRVGEDGVILREENLDGPRGPTEHLVQSIRQIDGRSSSEGVPLGDAVDGFPTTVVHPESRDYVLRDGPVNPPHTLAPLGLVLVEARDDVDGFGHRGSVERIARPCQRPSRPSVSNALVCDWPSCELRDGDGRHEGHRCPVLLGEQAASDHVIVVVIVRGSVHARHLDLPLDLRHLVLLLGLLLVAAAAEVPERVLLGVARRVEAVQRHPAKAGSGPDVHRALQPVQGSHVNVEEDGVSIGITIAGIHSLEPLRELHVADPVAAAVHHEAHRLAHGQRVVDIVIAIEIEDEGPVGHDGAGAHQGVHGSGLLVVVVAGPLLSRNVHQHRQAHVDVAAVDQILLVRASQDRLIARGRQHHLNDPRVVASAVLLAGDDPRTGPVGAIGHPGRLGDVQGLREIAPALDLGPPGANFFVGVVGVGSPPDGLRQAVDADLELVVLALNSPAVLHEVQPHLSFGGIPAGQEVGLRVARLDGVLPAEGNPDPGEAGGLGQRLEREERAAVVGEVA